MAVVFMGTTTTAATTVVVVANTDAFTNMPAAPPVSTTDKRRAVLRLERRSGFRSYVAAHGKSHGESSPPVIGDAPRKIDWWTMTLRRRAGARETGEPGV